MFGPLVAFGPGGVLAELIGSANFALAPLTDVDASELLGTGKAAKLVDGWRGAPAADRAALADLLHRLSRLAVDLPEVTELDLNPVLAGPDGCVAVDIGSGSSPARRRQLLRKPGEFCDDELVETEQSSRLRTLLQTGLAISSELSLDGVLQRIVEAAALVTGARYAALGVIDPSGTSLERFVTYGIDDETRAVIGDLPRGRGILGALITDARTLRLHDLSEDPRSVGFPPGHPPMRAFLGTPIVLRGVAYGNLYLTEKEDGTDFDEEDEELVVAPIGASCGRDRERAPLRVGDRLVEAARVAPGDQRRLAGELDLPRLLHSSSSGCGS